MNEKRKKGAENPLSFVFIGTLAPVIKVTPRGSQIKGQRINVGILILSFLVLFMT